MYGPIACPVRSFVLKRCVWDKMSDIVQMIIPGAFTWQHLHITLIICISFRTHLLGENMHHQAPIFLTYRIFVKNQLSKSICIHATYNSGWVVKSITEIPIIIHPCINILVFSRIITFQYIHPCIRRHDWHCHTISYSTVTAHSFHLNKTWTRGTSNVPAHKLPYIDEWSALCNGYL